MWGVCPCEKKCERCRRGLGPRKRGGQPKYCGPCKPKAKLEYTRNRYRNDPAMRERRLKWFRDRYQKDEAFRKEQLRKAHEWQKKNAGRVKRTKIAWQLRNPEKALKQLEEKKSRQRVKYHEQKVA